MIKPSNALKIVVAQQTTEKSVGVVKSGGAGPGSQSGSQDGLVVNVFQQEKPSFRARRAVWSRQLSPAPASAPPSLQPTQEAAHGHKFESLTRCGFKTICISLSPSLSPSHSSTLTMKCFSHSPFPLFCPSFLSNKFHC